MNELIRTGEYSHRLADTNENAMDDTDQMNDTYDDADYNYDNDEELEYDDEDRAGREDGLYVDSSTKDVNNERDNAPKEGLKSIRIFEYDVTSPEVRCTSFSLGVLD